VGWPTSPQRQSENQTCSGVCLPWVLCFRGRERSIFPASPTFPWRPGGDVCTAFLQTIRRQGDLLLPARDDRGAGFARISIA
jgi:hypothetical protein